MKQKRRSFGRQVMLFPDAPKGDTVPAGAKRDLVQALADLLLEALKVQTRAQGGGDDEREDHA
jgi:hypothetical protein